MSFAANPSAFSLKPPTSNNPLANAPPLGSSTQTPTNSNPFGASRFGGFGTQSQPGSGAATGGGFGSTSNTSTATPNLFGQPAQQGATGANTFGASSSGQTQPSIFGNTQTQNTQSQPGAVATASNPFALPGQSSAPGANMFSNPQTQNPAAGGSGVGMFGNAGQAGAGFGQSTTQGQAPQNPFGTFGTTQAQPQQQQSNIFGTGVGGFGSTQGQQQPQQQQQQQNPFGASIFGAQPQQQQAGGFGLQPQSALGASGFGSNLGASMLFGNRAPSLQGQQGGLGMPSGPPPFVKKTRFNDLPAEMKKEFEAIDAYLQSRIQVSKELHQRELGEETTKGQDLISAAFKDLVDAATAIKADLVHAQDLKRRVEQTVDDIIAARTIVDGFKTGQTLSNHINRFPQEYFMREAQTMKERLQFYRSMIEQLERKLSSSNILTSPPTPQGITQTIEAQNSTFFALATKVAALDTELQKIKVLYTQLWRARTGNKRDPFHGGELNDVGNNTNTDFGMKSLSGKP